MSGQLSDLKLNAQIEQNAAGLKWKYGTATAGTRLGVTQGKNAGSDFDKIYPYSNIKLCNVRDDGTIAAFIGDPTFKTDGTNGQVMVYLPKFYYKHTYDKVALEHEFWVSAVPMDSFKLHPAFLRAGVEKPYILVAAYKAGLTVDNKILSQAGIIPKTSATRANFRTYAQNRGSKWFITDVLTRSTIGLLYLIEYATTDSQVAIGKGVTELPYSSSHTITEASTNTNTIVVAPATGTQFFVGQIIGVGTSLGGNQIVKEREILSIDTSYVAKTVITVDGAVFSTAVGNIIYSNAQKTGKCDSLLGKSGMATGTNGKVSISYRGLEDLWGNIWEFIDGINIRNTEKQPYVADTTFSDDKFDSTYKPSGVVLPDASGYVKNFSISDNADWLLMPSEVGGGSTTYVPDYYYQNWAGLYDKIAYAGGYWNGGSGAGLFYWYCSDSSGHAYLDVGARALLIP
jgi:hypothetical protein